MGPPGPVIVAVGEDAVLPCRFSPAQSTQDMEVTWYREQLVPFVHHYKGSRDQNWNQMMEYVGRTELWKDGLAKGSVNLKIFDVQLSDRGNYTCFVVNGSDYDEAVVELKVTVSGSVPLITLERYQDGGIRVSCRSAGWYPRPHVLWRDPHGQHLPSLSESVTQDQSSLFVVESSIILTRGTKQNVSCWVRHVLDGQEQGSVFYISDPFFHNAQPLIIALVIVSVAVVALIIFAVYLFKIKGKREKQIAMRDAALRDRDAAIVWRRYAVPIEEGCAPVKMMLSSFHSCFSLPAFIVYGLVFQVHELHSAPLKVMGPPGPVIVAVGEDAVLPCRFSPAQSTQDMEVTWYREQLASFVHRYKGGRDQNWNQMLEYVGRTELWKDGLAKGSVNLKIIDVQLSDRGNYTCFVVNGSDYDQAVVELKVTVSGSVPLIALERYQDGGIRVSCRSAGWYPRPQVLWRDPHGQHLPSLSESVTQDQSSLFAVESSIILTRGTKQNVSCWVRHVLDGQERGSEFYISDPFFHNAHPFIIALGIVSVAVVALIIFAVYLFKIKAMRDAALRDRDAEIEAHAVQQMPNQLWSLQQLRGLWRTQCQSAAKRP
ncbi:butyrophilin subfamily 1 member A1 [Columba livia]|nr:butyrophilin subfamily 1 member A1 [Columba livia]